MLPRALLLALLLLPVARVHFPLPDRPPADFMRFGCIIGQSLDHGQPIDRWPLQLWIEIRGLAPQPDPENSDPQACDKWHSWCRLYSMESSEEKAHKDCRKWLAKLKKLTTPHD